MQRLGFARDAEQKVWKMMLDAWNVQKTAAPDETFTPSSVSNSEIDKFFDKVELGVGQMVFEANTPG
jgi:hypothetical protein